MNGEPKYSKVVWALSPVLTLGPALTCGIPRIMAPLFIACAIFAIIADTWERRIRPSFDKQLAIIFGGLLVYGAISYLWTINPDDTFKKLAQLAGIFVPLCALLPIIGRLTKGELKRMGVMLAAGLGLGLAVYFNEVYGSVSFYDLVRGGHSPDIADVRQNKPSVLLALWLYMVFPFLVPRQTIISRMIFLIAVPITFYAALWAKSASAQLIMACVPALCGFLYILPARLSLALTLTVTVFITAAMPFIAVIVYRDTNWQHNAALNDSVKSRIEIWNQASDRAHEKPIFGWGLDASPKLPNRDDKSVLYPQFPTIAHLHPHNAPIQIWFELGAIGIAGVCAMFLLFSRRIQAMADSAAQKYAVFMWASVFLYTLSIWGIWQTWFTATLAFAGVMACAGARYIGLTSPAARA